MNKVDLISIVIATYNRAELIGETIESVQSQTYSNWECIIVDDGSLDNTKEVVKNYERADSRIKYINRPPEKPKGPNGSRNYGIENAKGVFIMSLDSDDLLLPQYLELKVAVLVANPLIDGVLSKTIMVSEDKKLIKKEMRTYLTDNLLIDFITLKISWYMHDILWRKSFLENKTLFNENLFKMLDRDFHIRRLAEYPKLVLVDDYLALYRIHPNSNSSNSDIAVAESRHNAIMLIIAQLKEKKLLTKVARFFFFKHQVQNLVVLHKNPRCVKMYYELINETFAWNKEYIKWVLKLLIGYFSYKFTGRGLRFVQ